MKYRLRTLITMVVLSVPVSHTSFAYASEKLPAPLRKAAAAYQAKGASEFLPTLLMGSRLYNADKQPYIQAAHMLKEIEAHFGDYLGLELVSSVPITNSIRVVYFVLNYERGPLYGVASVYRAKNGEIVTSSNLNTELLQIIPEEVIAGIR